MLRVTILRLNLRIVLFGIYILILDTLVSIYICQKLFTEISLQMVSVPGPDFEYVPLSRPSLFHRDFNTPPVNLIIHDSSS